MKVISLSVPSPFSDGPQYDEDGELIPSSWPQGLGHEGIRGWHHVGVPDTGLTLCEFVAEDDYDTSSIPNGWINDSEHTWDGRRQNEFDENGQFVSSGLQTVQATDKVQYAKHIPEEDGNPVPYKRIHVYLGWPDILD